MGGAQVISHLFLEDLFEDGFDALSYPGLHVQLHAVRELVLELLELYPISVSQVFSPSTQPTIYKTLSGTRVEQIRRWKQATSYAERYLAKEEEFPEELETGRIWGIWNEKFLPIEWEKVKVSLRDAYKIRRVFRKVAKRRGTGNLRRMTVFVRYENVVRLLQFLGYSLE